MLKNVISQGDAWAVWPMAALVIFLTIYVVVTIYTYRKGGKQTYQGMADMVLNDEPPKEERQS